VGRWPKGNDPNTWQYRGCSVRSPRWHLVCNRNDGKKQWELFDISNDPGEKSDVAAKNPEVVQQLDAAYSNWWASLASGLINEKAVGPPVNPFKELYLKQFSETPGKK
jgi:arylsulfatase